MIVKSAETDIASCRYLPSIPPGQKIQHTRMACQLCSVHIYLVSEVIPLKRISPFVCSCAYQHVKVESELEITLESFIF